jgi:hypothetical protein
MINFYKLFKSSFYIIVMIFIDCTHVMNAEFLLYIVVYFEWWMDRKYDSEVVLILTLIVTLKNNKMCGFMVFPL